MISLFKKCFSIQDERCRFNQTLVAATVVGQVNITEVRNIYYLLYVTVPVTM